LYRSGAPCWIRTSDRSL